VSGREAVERTAYTIAIIPGDGIGVEVTQATVRVLDSLGLDSTYKWLEAGWDTFTKTGTALPDETLAAVRQCDGALFGAVSSPSIRVEGYSSPIIALRRHLDLFGNLRPAVSAPIENSQPGIDLLVVRENTEGLYVRQETVSSDGGRAVAERVITREASYRIARLAFEQAQVRAENAPHGKPQVTVVHKANVLPVTDGLFRESCLAVAEQYPDVKVEEQLVDSMAYRLIREPQRYDVVVAPNLYGDILSDAAAALVGGLGIAPSANVGDGFMLVEPVHGSAPDIAGQGIANPIAAILSGAILVRHLGEGERATAIEAAVQSVIQQGVVTPDLGGDYSTDQVTDAIIARLA